MDSFPIYLPLKKLQRWVNKIVRRDKRGGGLEERGEGGGDVTNKNLCRLPFNLCSTENYIK